MELRNLGRSGIRVGPLAFGGNVFGWTADEATSFRLLDAFVDAGLNLIDTADCYSSWAPGNKGGESETIIGNWLKRSGKRDKVVVTTKVGWEMPGRVQRKDLSGAWIREEVEHSLRRLQIDVIDLYQSHHDDLETPQEETLAAHAELIKAGKVRAIGASNFSAERFASALKLSEQGLPRYETMQPRYSLIDRSGYEGALEDLCRREEIGVITYSSLGSGFLSGKYRSEADLAKSVRGGGMKDRFNARSLGVLGALDKVAEAHGVRPATVALAWLIARPGITAPIASATTLEQLDDLLAATRLTLAADEIRLLDDAGK
ncbi:aryl-alcohol dehydrogenase-like predicted oxidoreductase [Inquilinus ginsengisoli]|uniref:Aryl-alcohol dehydrogenase-like predicted oxidoreductase n=1 Tax=Inquilinus ginsengisoli TaxID=363840 RepID=A0ABU1JGG4_9PROT|nr:aldo/keto reductase [Inquilinus ginsengisoli]MDR6287705.1 aryl-alcohol dehydrogenase-like predicted oxidoreductase [Inquilinus ginsengisoli]